MTHILPVLLMLVLLGCVPVTPAPEQLFRGTYSYGHDVDVVQLCGSNEIYWVWSQPEIQQRLSDEHAGLAEQATPTFYIEFSGELLKAPAEDATAGYDGLMHIKRIVELLQLLPEVCQ